MKFSVNVPQIAAFSSHQRDVDIFGGGLGGHSAFLLCDFDQRLVNVLGHSLRVAANVKIGTLLQPGPNLFSLFEHSVLDINLMGLIA